MFQARNRTLRDEVASDTTENEKMTLKPESMIIKAMSLIVKIWESLPVDLDEMN